MNKATAEQRIQRELLDGEDVLWVGLPFQGLVLHSFDLETWISGGMLCIVGALGHSLGISWFMLLGVCYLLGRPLFDSFMRANEVCYALTNHRAMAVDDDCAESAVLGLVEHIHVTKSTGVLGICSVVWFGDLPDGLLPMASPRSPDLERSSQTTDWVRVGLIDWQKRCRTLIFVLPEVEARGVLDLVKKIQMEPFRTEGSVKAPGESGK